MKKRPGTVFANHGDTESCEALRDRLIEQFGCKAIAPFSGTVFDLATNKVIYDAEGVPVKERHEGKSASTRRAERVYNTLVLKQRRSFLR
jgi:metallo-beta-lactamase family protein